MTVLFLGLMLTTCTVFIERGKHCFFCFQENAYNLSIMTFLYLEICYTKSTLYTKV